MEIQNILPVARVYKSEPANRLGFPRGSEFSTEESVLLEKVNNILRRGRLEIKRSPVVKNSLRYFASFLLINDKKNADALITSFASVGVFSSRSEVRKDVFLFLCFRPDYESLEKEFERENGKINVFEKSPGAFRTRLKTKKKKAEPIIDRSKLASEVKEQLEGGDVRALDGMYKLHFEEIKYFIFGKVRDSDLAKDLAQDTFIRALSAMRDGSYKDNGLHRAWLYRIASNLVFDHFRKSKKMPVLRGREDFDPFMYVEDRSRSWIQDTINSETEKKVLDLISHLPDEQFEVVVLRYFNGLSFKEVARIQDASINTCLGRMRYALVNLRKIIRENGIDLSGYDSGPGDFILQSLSPKTGS